MIERNNADHTSIYGNDQPMINEEDWDFLDDFLDDREPEDGWEELDDEDFEDEEEFDDAPGW
jgi:hypothetical protein